MKFSFRTGGLEWLTFEEAINELADIGYAACGPIVGPGCHLDPDTTTDSQKTAYKKLAKERNIAFSILNPRKVGGFAAGVRSGKTERFYRKALDLAADLGIPAVKFLCGTFAAEENPGRRMMIRGLKSLFFPGAFGGGEAAGWRAMIKVLKPICRHAEQVGVDLLMQNHENELIDTPNGFALLRHHVGSDQLQINLDCGNLAILMVDPCKVIHQFKKHIRHVRIKGMNNYYPFATQIPPGAPGDILDWEAIMGTLKTVGYTGYAELVQYSSFLPDFPKRAFAWAATLAAKVEFPRDQREKSQS